MVLHHVAQCPGPVIVSSTVLHPHCLRHGDLHMVDIAPVPKRLEKRVGEAEGKDVLHRLLPQVVINPVDLGFGKE